MASHWSSLSGLVTRTSSWIRVTSLLKLNSTSAIPVLPVMGAAVDGWGVQDRGIWPSPANSPLVASSPTQPAPGI